MGKWIPIIAAVLVAGGFAAWLLRGGSATEPEEVARRETFDDASEPRLEGRSGSDAVPVDVTPTRVSAAPWIAVFAAGGADEGRLEEAFARLHARLKGGALTLDELLDVSLLPGDEGKVARLRRLAFDLLREKGPAAAPLLGRLFDLLEGEDEHARKTAATVVSYVGKQEGTGMFAMPIEDDDVVDVAAIRPFLPRILALVADEDAGLDVRLAMMPLVKALGGEAADLAPVLIAWIAEVEKDREEFQRDNPFIHVSWHHFEFDVQEALSAIGPRALPAILEALRAEASHGNYHFEAAIQEMGPEANDALQALLADPDPDLRASALTALAANGKGEAETLALLRRFLGDDASSVRYVAVGRLKDYGAEAGEDLVAMLADPDDDVREAAARGLAAVPEAAAAALPRLLEIFRNGSYGERINTVGTLTKLGPAAAEATPVVLDLLGESLEEKMSPGFFTDEYLEAVKAFGEGALPHLLEAAAGASSTRRRAAIEALLNLDFVTAEALAPLASKLSELEGADRMRLAAALAAHEHPAAIRTLKVGLQSESREVRSAAAEALQQGAVNAPEVLPVLIEGLIENDALLHAEGANWSAEWTHYYAYYRAVQRVGQHDPEALVLALSHEHDEVAEAASKGIALAGDAGLDVLDRTWGAIPPSGRARLVGELSRRAFADEPSPRARDRVVGALDDPDPQVQLAAARVVRGEGLFERAVEVYISLLAEQEGEVAQDAAWRLRKKGAQLAPWREQLEAAQADTTPTAKRWIQDVLDAIDDAR